MKEKVLRLGATGGLVGVLTEPEVRKPGRPAFLLLNAGVVHRVGPNRLYVNLARRLAQSGFWACRFDVSGLGDSAVRQDGMPYHEARICETRDVMDHLQAAWGVDQFVMLGLCSAADHSFRMALAEPRVAGAVMLDGYVYPTRRYTLAQSGKRLWHARRRVMQAEAWRRVASGRHPMWGQLRAKLLGRKDVRMRFVMDVPPRPEAEAGVRQLMARGVRLLFLYTDVHVGLYRSAVRANMPFPPAGPPDLVRVVCMPESDHEFTLLSVQEKLFRTVAEWAESPWPPAVMHDKA